MSTRSSTWLRIVKAVGQTLFLFAFLAWLDGAVIQFTHPEWLAQPVSHLLNVRTDTFTIAMFLVSAFGFLIWRLSGELLKAEREKSRAS